MFTYHTESSIIIRLLFRIIRINHRRFVLSSQCLNKSYTQTLNLPQSNFPMKHSRKLELNLEQQVSFVYLVYCHLIEAICFSCFIECEI